MLSEEKSLTYEIAAMAVRYFQNPENMKRFEEWKKARKEKCVKS